MSSIRNGLVAVYVLLRNELAEYSKEKKVVDVHLGGVAFKIEQNCPLAFIELAGWTRHPTCSMRIAASRKRTRITRV
eukprot:6183731-Pleurochrysis_carterae.AAC.2